MSVEKSVPMALLDGHLNDGADYKGHMGRWSRSIAGRDAQGPIPTYVGSLTEEDQRQLAAQLESDLPAASDGSITLIARARAIRGTA